ncbi:MAG: hypothetical protein J6X53_09510 [Abditibacteriota bacterium]|nr:hypothetical protein [Abditibacteriota bacterium]
MDGQEGLILQGCGGPAQEWLDGINDLLTEEGILRDGTRFTEVLSFQHEGRTNLLFPIDNSVKVDMSALAVWRINSHDRFSGTWLSDFVPNRLGGFLQPVKRKPEMELAGHDGNIYSILGRASNLLKQAGMRDEAKEMCDRVMACGSYDEALLIVSEYVQTELSADSEPSAKPPKRRKSRKRPER